MSDRQRFHSFVAGRRTWAVGSIHGENERLEKLHAALAPRFAPGDNLVYLGNMLGRGPDVGATLTQVLLFRRRLLAQPGVHVDDIAFLRGSQEEMWQKLLTIQFAPDPGDVLAWMARHGIAATLAAYGSSVEEGAAAAQSGIRALTQWTSGLRDAMRFRDGHVALMSALKRAAFTADHTLLFVNTGIDPSRPLSEQTDSFWWGGTDFEALEEPYGDYRRTVRGYDPRHRGVQANGAWVCADGGCGFGGPLVALCFHHDGNVVDAVKA